MIVPEMVTDGVKVGTVGVEVDPLQAEMATGARRVRARQHRAVSLARSVDPAIVVRTFMDPPHAPGRCHCFSRSRRQKPLSAGKGVTGPVTARAAAGRSPKRQAAINALPVARADGNGLFTIGILG